MSAFLAQRPVLLAAPYPPAECERRLAAATGRRLSWTDTELPLQGQVSPDQIRVARRAPAMAVWFSGRIERAPGDRTVVAGTVGPAPAARVVFAVISWAWLVIFGVMFLAGLSSLRSGHPELWLLLFPVGFAAVWVLFRAAGPPLVRYEIRELLGALNPILDSTAAFPGR